MSFQEDACNLTRKSMHYLSTWHCQCNAFIILSIEALKILARTLVSGKHCNPRDMLSIDPVQLPTLINLVSPQIPFLSQSPYPSISSLLTFLGTAAVAFAMSHHNTSSSFPCCKFFRTLKASESPYPLTKFRVNFAN